MTGANEKSTVKKFGDQDFGNTLAELKAMAPHAQTIDGVKFEGNAKKVSAILILAGVGSELIAEIERLQAVEASVIDMATMLGNREWAEHAGKGAAADLESRITTLHNELSEKQDDAERFAFFAHVAVNDELHEELEPHMPADAEQPETIEGVRAHMDLCIQAAKDAGLWPIKPEPELTDEAQADRDDFVSMSEERGCSCHISPPCGYCAHPGNPMNQEDPSCWKVAP